MKRFEKAKPFLFIFFLLAFACDDTEISGIDGSTLADTGEDAKSSGIDVFDDIANTKENESVDIDVFLNDKNFPPNITISNTNPSSGLLVINDNETTDNLLDDTITYTPNADYSGADSFEYTICEATNSSNCDTGTVSITVQSKDVIETELKAFPEAEGFGKYSTGGRGGSVLRVTNLDDSGPGSFREACEASGARTVVFNVGGRINLAETINITNPNITIAGQTALGDGITLSMEGVPNKPMMSISTNDVILRYITFRRSSVEVTERNSDGLRVSSGSNTIIDHCSFSWASDENVSVIGYEPGEQTSKVTFQYSIIANAYHGSSKGSLNSGRLDKISYFRNMFISNTIRNPQFGCNEGSCNTEDSHVEVVNNVVYDYKYGMQISVTDAGFGVINGNYIKNIAMQPTGRGDSRRFLYMASDNPIRIYVEGNIDPKRPTDDLDNWESTQGEGGIGEIDILGNVDYRSSTPFPTQIVEDGVTLYDANDIWSNIRTHVGASYPTRDSFDDLMVNDIDSGTTVTDALVGVGGFPTLENGTALADTDGDGMPDVWETANGYKPDSDDGKEDKDGDGYTNLEEYLNALAK